jgi:hypothetical protein
MSPTTFLIRYNSAMKQLAIFVGLLLITAPARAQSSNIHENVDPYTGLRTLYTEITTNTCPGDPSLNPHDPDVHLLFSASENSDHTVSYWIEPELDHGSSLNVRAKSAMDILIDGNAGSFTTPSGSSATTAYDANRSYLHETIPYVVTLADIEPLTQAKLFQFRINGPRFSIQRCADAKHLRNLDEFLNAAASYGLPQQTTITQYLNPTQQPLAPEPNLKPLRLEPIDTFACPGDAAARSSGTVVHLSLEAAQHPPNKVMYFLTADIHALTPLNLHIDDKMEARIGSVVTDFPAPRGSNITKETDPTGNTYVHETIKFRVDRSDLITLYNAGALQFRIGGPNNSIQRCTDRKQLSGLGKFINSSAAFHDHPVAMVTIPSVLTH